MPTPQRASRDDPRDGLIRVITAMPPRAQAAGLRVRKTPLDGLHANPTMQEAKFKLSHYRLMGCASALSNAGPLPLGRGGRRALIRPRQPLRIPPTF